MKNKKIEGEKIKNENLIHLRLEYDGAIQSKKNILYSEKSLMIIAKTMNNYLSLREEELKAKLKLHRKVKEAVITIKKLQKIVPKVKVPKILEKEKTEEKKIIKLEPKRKKDNDNIEFQLQDIQEKLNALQK